MMYRVVRFSHVSTYETFYWAETGHPGFFTADPKKAMHLGKVQARQVASYLRELDAKVYVRRKKLLTLEGLWPGHERLGC